MSQSVKQLRDKKFVLAVFLFLVLLGSTAKAQSDVLLEDDISFENGEVSHNLTAYAEIENVKLVDMYVSNVSDHRTNFLGGKYYVINRSVGDMDRGENIQISYDIRFSDYALLGGNTFQYEAEKHRLSPKRIEAENSNNFFLWLVIFIVLTLLYLVFDFIRSRP